MNALVGSWLERFLGRGRAAVTVPPLDGALKPNNRLDDAPRGIASAAPDNLVACDGAVFWSSGVRLFRAAAGAEPEAVATLDGVISALAVSPRGQIAVACEGKGISILARDGSVTNAGRRSGWPTACITSMTFADETSLIVCVGSVETGLDTWQRDLMEHRRAGEVWKLDLVKREAKRLAAGLGYPNGVVVAADRSLIVSEAWDVRLVRRAADGRELAVVLDDLPGYPGRVAPSARGGYWLTVFAPRSPLIEFVLREDAYRRAMLAEVPPAYWIAPALRSGVSFHEPMQGGALKQMGILKPWAPTLSYGLVIELDANFVPLQSLHSRAGGKRHGITSAVELDGRLWLTAKGGDEIIAIDRVGREGK
ncbi:strictosidine synthase [Bradyrhizobium sp. HKCCYLR20261]|uniref:strictosidine synthase n=1 Tax=Bradyrhizobium sp. HKCCYLR20261 TaxID=3420760 RepID=UPI003EB91907